MADSREGQSNNSPQVSNTEQPVVEQLTNINDLIDNLLIEIFIRLPTCQSAHVCKCVCKRWLNLISNPYFIRCFINHQSRVSVAKPFTLLHQFKYFRYDSATDTREPFRFKVHAISDHPLLQPRGNFDLDYLPFRVTYYQETVVASYKDLLVCYDRYSYGPRGTTFYICNPLTKQCLALPPAPSRYSSGLVGFVTYTADCYSDGGGEEDSTISSISEIVYNYKLVQIIRSDDPGSAKEFNVEIFSSETGEWTKSLVLIPSRRYSRWHHSHPNAVIFKRKLHWITNKDSLLAFDPFDCDNQCRFIDLPILEVNGLTKKMDWLGVCQEHLRVSLLVLMDRSYRVFVWDLKEYDAGEWCFVNDIWLKEMKFVSNHLFSQLRLSPTCVLAFHPNDEAVFYLRYGNQIVVCNVQEGTLEVISECIKPWTYNLMIQRDSAFSLEHSCWPSPIP